VKQAAANLARFGEEAGGFARELETASNCTAVPAELDQQREIAQQAERELQEAVFQAKTSSNKIAEVERTIAAAGDAIERLRQAWRPKRSIVAPR